MKRLICIICVIALMSQVLVLTSASAASMNADKYNLIFDIGILGENIVGTDILTYENLAKAAVSIATGSPFSGDDALKTAKDIKLIKEDTAAGKVSLDTAVKVILRSAGYINDDANMETQMMSGKRAAVLKGVSVADSNGITMGEFAVLVLNALDTETIRYNGVSSYENSGKTVIEERFKLKKIQGTLFSGLMMNLNKDRVVIDNVTYRAQKNFDRYAGKTVTAYLNKDDEVVSVTDAYYNNLEYIISANDIISVYNCGVEIYDVNGNNTRLDISSSAVEIYNGMVCPFSYNDMNIANGFIRLIKGSGADKYNVVIIEEYNIMVAGGVSNGVIYDYNSNGANVNLNKAGLKLQIKMNNKEAAISDIEECDVLYIMYSKNRELLTIQIVRNTIRGTVELVSDDYVKIGRKNYGISAYYKQYSSKLEVGKEAELILDSAGFIVSVKRSVNVDAQYGYFMGLGQNKGIDTSFFMRLMTESGTISKLKIRSRVTVNGKTVKNDGVLNGDLDKAFKVLTEFDVYGTKTVRNVNDYVYQLIIYSTNSDGEIISIDTAEEAADEINNENQLTYDAFLDGETYANTTGGRIIYKSGPKQFVDRFGISGEFTKCFYVPAYDNVFDAYGDVNMSRRREADPDDYTLTSPDAVFVNDQQDALIGAYNITKGGVAAVCVIYNKDIGADPAFKDDALDIFILSDLGIGINSDGEECYQLTGYLKGNEVTYYMDKEDYGRSEGPAGSTLVYVEPQAGDIMQIKADVDGNVLRYSTRYRLSTDTDYYATLGNSPWREYGAYSAYIYDQDKYGIVTVEDTTTLSNKRTFMKDAVSSTYIMRKTRNDKYIVEKGTVNDGLSYVSSGNSASKVFVRGTWGVINTMIIFAE